MQIIKPFAAALVSSALLVGASTATMAAPMPNLSVAPPANTNSSSGELTAKNALQKVRWRGRRWHGRRWHHRRRHRGRWIGPAIGAGIAAAIIGGAISSSRHNYRDRWERCDDRYKTFSWKDGTYIPYVGSPRVLCPYLRR